MKGFAFSSCIPAALCAWLSGCAGPTTPLGAVWIVAPSQIDRTLPVRGPGSLEQAQTKGIRFFPARQVLHGPHPVTVAIRESNLSGAENRLKIRYDGVDVTQSFLRQARIERDEAAEELLIRVPVLRLSPDKFEHRIEVMYWSPQGKTVYARYAPPQCRAFEMRALLTTEDFNPSPEILESIDSVSRMLGFSPAFTAALVAQESSFRPKTISWARAIGLTQVTPIADAELERTHPEWPRYSGTRDMPATLLRFFTMQGTINRHNEWRLDPELSIRGGLEYLESLHQKWASPDHLKRLAVFPDQQLAQTQLILASYNSGYARVLAALTKYGPGWMNAPELDEARRYVNRITSFCDHFSDGEIPHEI